MRYDFDTIIDRRGTYSLKWDVAEGELPMWVADMDFRTAPAIIDALSKRVEHGIFGYSIVPEEWNSAICNWWERRHSLIIDPESLVFCTGVVPAISSIVRKLTTPNENVVIQTPVYNIFFNSIINNGCRVLESPLKENNGEYSMDFEDLEEKLSNPQTTLMILCNPHNPVGKIWDRDTLARVGELCRRYNVTVISDEIHCDITKPGMNYVPFASVSEACREVSITCIAPTKTFNIAGLNSAAVMVPNANIRHKVWRALNTDEVAEPNAFAMTATIAAFGEGEEWLCELCEYIEENKRTVADFFAENSIPISIAKSEATYLLWLDCSKLTDDTDVLAEEIRKKTGLYMSAGSAFGGNGRNHIRLNVACPRQVLMDGLNRLKAGL